MDQILKDVSQQRADLLTQFCKIRGYDPSDILMVSYTTEYNIDYVPERVEYIQYKGEYVGKFTFWFENSVFHMKVEGFP